MSERLLKVIELEFVEGARLFVVDHAVVHDLLQCAQRTGMTFENISTQSCRIEDSEVSVPEGFVLLRVYQDKEYKGRRLLDFDEEFKLNRKIESGSVIAI